MKEKIQKALEIIYLCNDLDTVCRAINKSDEPNIMAAAYAIDATEDAGFGYGDDEIEVHLDCLDCATFDYQEAKNIAMRFGPLTDYEVEEYAREMVNETGMTEENRLDFLENPDKWEDGIVSNHVIAHREHHEIFCDDWDRLKTAIIKAIEDKDS